MQARRAPKVPVVLPVSDMRALNFIKKQQPGGIVEVLRRDATP
jgi:hypothetical protein